jgi:hypothetical protein
MTISTTVRTAGPYSGTGSNTGPFGFDFKVFQASDLRVTVSDLATQVELGTLVLNVDYSVALNTDQNVTPGGTITLSSPLASGRLLSMTSDIPITQGLSIPNLSGFYPRAIEDAIDKLVAILQQLGGVGTGQTLRVPELAGVPLLPVASSRANTQLLFDSMGKPYVAAPVSGSAADVLLQLVNSTDVTKGASLIGTKLNMTGSAGRLLSAKLADSVSVMDFTGADPTGAGDSTAAFTAALATGRSVFVPDGTYKITSTLTISNTQQHLWGAGRAAILNFVMAVASPGIRQTGSSGRQRVTCLTLNGVSNCTRVISHASPQVQVFFNWITNLTSGGHGVYLEDENVPSNLYSFGAQVGYNFIHGSFTTGSRGVRLGLNSQTTQIFGNCIDNWETGVAVDNATDSLVIENNVIEQMMSTGYGVDMRSTGGSPTMRAVTIRGNHFEDVYKAIGWGNNVTGPTYTSCVFEGNYMSGHTAGTCYFLSIEGLCGAASANNRVAHNEAAGGTLTAFFNLTDANGARSLVEKRGNTLPGGALWATGSQAAYGWRTRANNAFYGNVLVSGSFAGTAVNRVECGTVSFTVPFRLDAGEYLENIQFKYVLGAAGTPTVTVTLHKVVDDTDTSVATTGALSPGAAAKTLTVNASGEPGAQYYLGVVCTAGGGTGYVYPFYANLRA